MLSSPRKDVSPYPSIPSTLRPQHLTLPSPCKPHHHPQLDLGVCRAFPLKAPHRSPDLLAAVLVSCLASYGYCSHVFCHSTRSFDSNQTISLQDHSDVCDHTHAALVELSKGRDHSGRACHCPWLTDRRILSQNQNGLTMNAQVWAVPAMIAFTQTPV